MNISRARAWAVRLLAGRSPASDTKALGARGERLAAKHLSKNKYRVLERNARTPIGEADLVCLAPDRRTIVIVEVKTRRARADGTDRPPPEANITQHKRRKLVAVAQDLARRRGWHDRRVQIDVVAVELPHADERGGRPVIRHLPDCVTASGGPR